MQIEKGRSLRTKCHRDSWEEENPGKETEKLVTGEIERKQRDGEVLEML